MYNTDIPPTVTITEFEMPEVVANRGNAIAIPIFAFLAILIAYLPLRSFYRVKNIAACSIMIIIIIVNLFAFLNGLIWPSDDWRAWWPGYGLCDVQVILRFPITMALATFLCCLSKGLADALDTEHAVFNPSKRQRRRKMVGDILFCWAVPVMQMALHYTVQAGRYMIIPVWGCADQLDNSWPMLVIIIIWCPIFTLLNVYYAVLMLLRLYRHRRTISAALTTTGSGLAPRKFIKLVLISTLLIIIYLPVSTLFVFNAIPDTMVPYSWSRIHNPVTWSPILYVHTGMQPNLQWYGWAGVATSAMMFVFFGFNDDAVDSYRWVLVKCGLGMVWPSLKLSREARRQSETLVNNTLQSKSSFVSHLDIVGKAMKYFDAGARKDSYATGVTLVDGSTTASRKGSQGTFSNTTTSLSHIPTSTSTAPSYNHKQAISTTTTSYFSQNQHLDDDAVTTAPSHYGHGESSIPPTTLTQSQTPSSTTPLQNSVHRGGVFGLFRTHLNLPFDLFPSPSKEHSKSASNSRDQAEMAVIRSLPQHIISEKDTDIEAQNRKANAHPRRTPSIPSHATATVSTNIWSPPPSSEFAAGSKPGASAAKLDSATTSQPRVPSMDLDATVSADDPYSPKLGTRAYRERERREFKSASSGPSSAKTKHHHLEQTRGYADDAHPEHGRGSRAGEEHASQGLRAGAGMGMSGVVVRRSLDIKEERADSSAPVPAPAGFFLR